MTDKEDYGSCKPFKVWDAERKMRKSLVAFSLKDLEMKGKQKLNIPMNECVRMVLESDGTQLEDREYFRTLPYNTVIMILRNEQRWNPLNIDALRKAIEVIPKIVCETLHALDLQEECPSWKIMDNKGHITVVLHWEHERRMKQYTTGASYTTTTRTRQSPFSSAVPRSPVVSSYSGLTDGNRRKMPQSILKDKSASFESYASSGGGGGSFDFDKYVYPITSPADIFSQQQRFGRFLKVVGGSFERAAVHQHTLDCMNRGGSLAGSPYGDIRPDSPPSAECDFHCCILHEEGREIRAVTRSVATSPIHQFVQPGASTQGTCVKKPGKNVRFVDAVKDQEKQGINGSECKGKHRREFDWQEKEDEESSEDTSTCTITEEDNISTDKFLLLVDEQQRHLSIKDIGIILERLSAKIVDVKRLDRESENDQRSSGSECYNWTIKATIKGRNLEEIGLIYAGKYYEISEHPSYYSDKEEDEEEEIVHFISTHNHQGKSIVQNIEARV